VIVDFLLTCDVESFSIPRNRCDRETAHEVYLQGLPRVLALCAKHDIPATFYFTGELAEIVPEAIDLVRDHAHEIGCHGYSHEVDRAFDTISYEEQLSDITKAKTLLESVTGKVTSFRAPALRINDDTIKVLEKTGFSSDSSTCPQRFDGPLTFGSTKKLKWLVAKRKPFFLDADNSILEIPISAFIVPYIGTTMRISPVLTRLLGRSLYFEARHTGKPVVFLFHPNECLDPTDTIITTSRTKNPIKHLFADRIRQHLKLRRLGMAAIGELEEVILNAHQQGFDFCTASGYRKRWN
jgi:peptidoglycan/xylan/chitin deacetylase (PgdA/CDA1 family)